MHYLDNSATTQVLPEAAETAMRVMMEEFGNPSSQHSLGIRAARLLKESREAVAAALGAQPGEITFTSGGTEAIKTAMRENILLQQRSNMRRHATPANGWRRKAAR